MTLFDEFDFFLWLAVLSAPAIILGVLEKKLKYYSFLVTIFFVGMTLKNSPEKIGRAHV